MGWWREASPLPRGKAMSLEAIEYAEDPDYVLLVNVVDPATGKLQSVEVGYGYKDGKRGPLYYLNTDPYSRQMLAEAVTMRTRRFVREQVEGVRKPGTKPRPSYRPTAGMSR